MRPGQVAGDARRDRDAAWRPRAARDRLVLNTKTILTRAACEGEKVLEAADGNAGHCASLNRACENR